MPPKDVQYRGFDDLLQHRLVITFFPGFHLQLSGAGWDDGGQVGDAGDRLRFAGAQGAPRGVGGEILVVRDRDPDADARPLVDFRAAAGQLRHLGDDLFHEVGHHHRQLVVLEIGALLLHDSDFILDIARVVGTDLCPEAVLQRRDDPSAIRVVLGIGAGYDIDVDRQAHLEPADLDIALLDQVE